MTILEAEDGTALPYPVLHSSSVLVLMHFGDMVRMVMIVRTMVDLMLMAPCGILMRMGMFMFMFMLVDMGEFVTVFVTVVFMGMRMLVRV
jgi:hypothetical protein